MSKLVQVGILGVGSYTPENIMTNFDFEKIIETSDEWIRTRTGIKERRIATEDQATSDLATEAAKNALKDANVDAFEIDLVIVATMSPDYLSPSVACLVQDAIGAVNAGAFDLGAACSGQVYALTVAKNFIATGMYKKVLVIGAETLSKVIDWEDRTTCVLFGDGASAFVLGEVEDGYGILSAHLAARGAGENALKIPAGGSRNPASHKTVDERQHYLKMNGREVFKFAVGALPETLNSSVESAGLTLNDISLIVPHQANYRIVSAAAKKLDLSEEMFYMNLDRYGNTSAASIGLAFDEAYKNGKINKGDNIVFAGFGAGLAYASIVLKWAK